MSMFTLAISCLTTSSLPWTMDRGLWHCTGGRDQDHSQEKEMQKGKMVVWRGLLNSWEKKRSKRQRRKGKIYPFEYRVSIFNIVLYSIGFYFYHQSHPQLGIFLLWLRLFILSGVNSPLFSSSILGTYRRGEFIFQCPIFLPFHTVHRVLKARILKWFAIPFTSGPCFVRTVHNHWSILGGPTWPGS